MSTCTDIQVGKLLHDYEMGWLSEDDHERFELHLMECQCCFAEVRQFRHVARLLADDEVVKVAVGEVSTSSVSDVTWWSRLRELFWPGRNLLLKPAIIYLAVIILLPLAYKGVYRDASTERLVRPVQTVDLVATRGSARTVRPHTGTNLVLNFAFEGAVAGQHYSVTLRCEKHGVIYENDHFGFNDQQVAQLSVPGNLLSEGEYLVIINDPSDSSILGTDTLRFTVEN